MRKLVIKQLVPFLRRNQAFLVLKNILISYLFKKGTKKTDQTAKIHRLICNFVVCMITIYGVRQVFSFHGSNISL